MSSRLLMSRLFRDLVELQESPYPGVAVFTGDELRSLCLVLTPPSGPWKDLALHFDVVLPDNWPSSPPRIQCTVQNIDHPNLFGSYICCDLLKEQSELQRGYTGGYTPALTLRGLFLQFLTFFSSSSVEQDYGNVSYNIGDYNVVQYMPEEQICSLFRLLEGSSYSCSRSDTAFERAWNEDSSPEIVLAQYETARGLAVHSVKQGTPHKRRIHKLSYKNPRWQQTLDLISHHKCKRCPYGSDELPHHSLLVTEPMDIDVVSPLLVTPRVCHLTILDHDTLYTLAGHLSSEMVHTLSQAYPPFRQVVESFHVLLKREVTCFFLRSSLNNSVMGIGVSLNVGSRVLSSDFDWLSEEAFDKHAVRTSIQKRPFELFLPLAFSPAHFERVQPAIWTRLAEIERAVRAAWVELERRTRRPSNHRVIPPTKRSEQVEVIYQLMNSIVVSLMNSCDDVLAKTNQYDRHSQATLLHASEKAIGSYCHLFHLLICLCRANPAILQDATRRVRSFLDNPASRLKKNCPDIGEFTVISTLVLVFQSSTAAPASLTWSMINGPILEEVFIRNVRWVLKDHPELEVTESGQNQYRLVQTFMSSKTSLRLVMFQVTFLDMFVSTYSADLTQLDNNYGFADKAIPGKMVEQVKQIYRVNTWRAYFERVKFARGVEFGPERFTEMLRQVIKTSGERRYHDAAPPRALHRMSTDRDKKEKSWNSSALQSRA